MLKKLILIFFLTSIYAVSAQNKKPDFETQVDSVLKTFPERFYTA